MNPAFGFSLSLQGSQLNERKRKVGLSQISRGATKRASFGANNKDKIVRHGDWRRGITDGNG